MGSARRRDLAAGVGLVAATVAVQLPLLAGRPLLGMDAVTQFLPWYGWLGANLRDGQLPLWNPAVFAGAPFLADPLSGWGYLPAMLAFTLLPLPVATVAYLALHPALAAAGAYLLARCLRLPPAAALVTGVAYAGSGFVLWHNPCCFAFVAVVAWLPFVLAGADRAVAAGMGPGRVRWWALAAVALSQVLAGWPGQGSLYVAVLTVAWVAWRTALSVPAGTPLRTRAGGLALHAGAVLGLGAALGAAGLLPRLEYNAVSNLAGGYPDGLRVAGGWSPADWLQLVVPGRWDAGAVTVTLGLTGLALAGRRYAARFWAASVAAALVLSTQAPTPLHLLLSTVPTAARLHPHGPERIVIVAYLGIALLAGAAVARLRLRRGPAWLPAVAVLLLVAGELAVTGTVAVQRRLEAPWRSQRVAWTDVAALASPGPAGRFLRDAGGRYVSYAPEVRDGKTTSTAYAIRWAEPLVTALEANNRALLGGGATIQGYAPAHVARYDDLIEAVNGRGQDYHFADVLPPPGGAAGRNPSHGLGSPLLDLLGVRWVVVPAEAPDPDPAGIGALIRRLPTAFTGGGARVLERRGALPRAWLVHEARRVDPGAAPALLAGGEVDPRRTALLEVDPPPLAAPADRDADRVEEVSWTDARIQLRTTTGAPGLLLLSEVSYPAWRATVDGAEADVLVADHALRAVAVPAGTATVTLTYDSPALTAGLAVTAVAAVVLAAAAAPRPSRRRKTPSRRGSLG